MSIRYAANVTLANPQGSPWAKYIRQSVTTLRVLFSVNAPPFLHSFEAFLVPEIASGPQIVGLILFKLFEAQSPISNGSVDSCFDIQSSRYATHPRRAITARNGIINKIGPKDVLPKFASESNKET